MRWILKLLPVAAAAVSLAVAQPALAKTYKLPIDGGRHILKVFVDGGKAKRVGQNGTFAIYEVTMETDTCMAEVTVIHSFAYGRVRNVIDICSEHGFGITIGRY